MTLARSALTATTLLRATTPPDTGNAASGSHTSRAKWLGSVFILVLGHGPCALLAVTSMVSSRQPDQPIILIGLRRRPAPDRAHQLRPPTLCLPSVVSGSIRRVAPQLRRTDPTLPQPAITPTVTPASPPLDGVTSTWVIIWTTFPSSTSQTPAPRSLPLVAAVGHLRVVLASA